MTLISRTITLEVGLTSARHKRTRSPNMMATHMMKVIKTILRSSSFKPRDARLFGRSFHPHDDIHNDESQIFTMVSHLHVTTAVRPTWRILISGQQAYQVLQKRSFQLHANT